MLIAATLVLLVLLLIIGVPIPISFLGASLLLIVGGDYDPSFLLPYGYSKMNNVIILAIPLFILSGGLVNHSKVGDKLVELVDIFVGRVRGALGVISIISCAVFGSITGSAATGALRGHHVKLCCFGYAYPPQLHYDFICLGRANLCVGMLFSEFCTRCYSYYLAVGREFVSFAK